MGYFDNGSLWNTLTMRWNGSTWSVANSPNKGSGNNILLGVDAISVSNVWSVGSYSDGYLGRTLTKRWNGSIWSVVTGPK